MITKRQKKIGRRKRHVRIRNKVMGSKERPRLNVFRSLRNVSIQLIDDIAEKTLLSSSTQDKAIKTKAGYAGNVKAAAILGEEFAKKAQAEGFKKVVFDRGGFLYHGRVKALADALRKGGLEF